MAQCTGSTIGYQSGQYGSANNIFIGGYSSGCTYSVEEQRKQTIRQKRKDRQNKLKRVFQYHERVDKINDLFKEW